MFDNVVQLMTMLDNIGPTARTAPAPYQIVDCEKQSAAGLTCNAVISSNMEPPGNKANGCDRPIDTTGGYQFVVCNDRNFETVGVATANS